MAESCANSSSEEWKSKVKEVEEQLEEANKLERSASLSLESVMKQLERSNDKLHDTESEITNLKEKMMKLETTISRQKEDLEESEQRLGNAEEEISKINEEVENLKSELETVEEEKNRALQKEQDAVLSVQRLSEQKKKLLSELESSKEEEDKSKKAMESLKEKLLSQGDHEYEIQIEDLKLVIKATNEKYENMIDEARHEIDVLVSAVEQTRKHFESSKTDWEMKEANLVNNVKKMEEEVASMGKEMNRLDNLLKRTEEEADTAWKKEAQTKDSLKEVEEEVVYLQEIVGEAKAESMKLKENLLDKETEFQSLIQENEDLREKEDVSMKKIEELTKLFEEAILAKKQTEEDNGEISESEKDYDLLPKVVEFSSENGYRSVEEKSLKVETFDHEDPREHISNGNGKEEKDVNRKAEKEKKEESAEDDSVEVIFKLWESCQIEKKEAFPDKKSELESQEEEEEEDSSKVDESDKNSTENIDDKGNSLTAEDELRMEKKIKKKTLLGKVGNLLKKKTHFNPK